MVCAIVAFERQQSINAIGRTRQHPLQPHLLITPLLQNSISLRLAHDLVLFLLRNPPSKRANQMRLSLSLTVYA